jgi:hypothetical protein
VCASRSDGVTFQPATQSATCPCALEDPMFWDGRNLVSETPAELADLGEYKGSRPTPISWSPTSLLDILVLFLG